MNWYAIHTKPRQEAVAQTSLQREGIETFLPKLRQRRTIRRVRRWVTGPLFPGYIFAKFDPIKSARLVKYANGVTHIVSFGGRAAPVDDSIIAEIRCRAEADIVTVAPPQFRRGDRVEIQGGPLHGLQGMFEKALSGPQRVAVLLNLIRGQARVEVSADALARLD